MMRSTILSLFALLTVAHSLPAAEKPNILLVMLDDVGAEAFTSYYGNPVNSADGQSIDTPEIDALASTGMVFTNALSTPLCTPTRVQLLTGQYSYRNYRTFAYLDNAETTVAQVLRAHGYTTAVAGKWQLGTVQNHPSRHTDSLGTVPSGPTVVSGITPRILEDDYGFDAYRLWYVNFTFTNKGSRYWDPRLEEASGDGSSSVVIPSGNSVYGPDQNAAFLKQFITDAVAAGTPFFAYYPMILPHSPWVGTPDSVPVGDKVTSDPVYFDDNIEYIDALMGSLIDHLSDPDGDPHTDDSVVESTLVIFTSDNGTEDIITVQTDSGPVTGGKTFPTYYGTHVPFIVSWPGTVPAGSSKRMVDFTDIFPTLLEVAGVDVPASLGLDGLPIIDANGVVQNNRDIAYCYYKPLWGALPDNAVWEFAQDLRYKLYGDGRFYDIDADPAETTDLVGAVLTPDQQLSMDALQAELDRQKALQDRSPVFLNGITQEVLDTDLDGNGDSVSTSFVRFGDNDANNKAFRTVAEFDLTDPGVASLLTDFGSATLVSKVTFTKGTPPDLRVVALSSGENGLVSASDYQAPGTEVAVVSGLEEGDEIRIDVTEFVRADLGQSFTAFRFEGIGIDPPNTPGADQVRLSGKPGVDDTGLETATRLIIAAKGDFDESGAVNLADFDAFRSHLGAGRSWDRGDLDEDGNFDAADFLPFRDRFGPFEREEPDYNGDGRPDLIDYALQILDPADARLLPAVEIVEEAGASYLQARVRRFEGGAGDLVDGYAAGGVRSNYEFSTDLMTGGWDSGSAFVEEVGSPVSNGDGSETVTVRAVSPVESAPDGVGFLRLSVEGQ